MDFLQELTIAAAIPKVKLKATPKGRIATIEFCVPIAEGGLKSKLSEELQGKLGDVEVSVELIARKAKGASYAGADEILAAVPKSVLKAYNAMHPKGATMARFDGLVIDSQNIEARMAPDVKKVALRLQDVDLTDLRLEALDERATQIGLYFSACTPLTKDVGEFVVTNLGQFVFLQIQECQTELSRSAGA